VGASLRATLDYVGPEPLGLRFRVAFDSSVYYHRPTGFDPAHFTKGTDVTRIVHLKRGPVGSR